MKKVIWILLLLGGCQTLVIPDTFTYKEIETDTYKLASWQKITDTKSPVRIYIEGDGYALITWVIPQRIRHRTAFF